MPHAIADSDDDGDDIDIYVGEQVDNRSGPPYLGSNQVNGGTNGRSTGSTERLRRNMLDAERRLMTNSAPLATTGMQQSSPSLRAAQKRRHTAISGSEPLDSQEKSVKRTKTLRTYGSKRSSQAIEDGNFDRLRDDEPAPTTSQSARFTEHSGFHSSAGLPDGSLGQAFRDHEPIVMFRDSGSTVADASSAQQRMLDEALGRNKGLSTSAMNEVHAGEDDKSSSFPWSASAKTRASAKSTGDEGRPQVDTEETHDQTDEAAGATFGSDKFPAKAAARRPSPAASPAVQLKSQSEPRPSPAVEIPHVEHESITAQANASTGTQKSTRGRKRKVEDDNTDPLNSDDKAIGLPKERYQPRPSRRRATAVLDEPIDYSVRPEKAAKAKRTRTTTAERSFSTAVSETALTPSNDREAKRSKVKSSQDAEPPRMGTSGAHDEAQKHAVEKGTGKNAQEKLSQNANRTPTTDVPKSDDQSFVKPAIPTPKARSTTKAKRSHTTIFEDHVEFAASQRSPSLSQQQAERKTALQDVQNEATGPSQKKRRVVVDDDEEEDELANKPDESSVKEDLAPKKRTRGRPPKSSAKPEAKSAEKVLEDSEDEHSAPSASEDAPKKRGRGRPTKNEAEATLKLSEKAMKDKPIETPNLDQTLQSAALPDKGPSYKSTKPESTLSNSGNPAKGQLHTPSPEKNQKKPTKASPITHSPIKSSTKVPLRVGLSKTHRIPPLLRTMRPPKR